MTTRRAEVTLLDQPGQRPRSAPRLIAALGVIAGLVLVALAAGAVLTDPGVRAHRRPHPAPVLAVTDENAPASTNLTPAAFEFRGLLRCQNLTIARSDSSYARARPRPGTGCRYPAPSRMVILHEVHGEWRVVVSSTHFPCPVAGLPAAVAVELRVCPPVSAAGGG